MCGNRSSLAYVARVSGTSCEKREEEIEVAKREEKIAKEKAAKDGERKGERTVESNRHSPTLMQSPSDQSHLGHSRCSLTARCVPRLTIQL